MIDERSERLTVRRERQRGDAYQKALRRLRDENPDRFAELYEDEKRKKGLGGD